MRLKYTLFEFWTNNTQFRRIWQHLKEFKYLQRVLWIECRWCHANGRIGSYKTDSSMPKTVQVLVALGNHRTLKSYQQIRKFAQFSVGNRNKYCNRLLQNQQNFEYFRTGNYRYCDCYDLPDARILCLKPCTVKIWCNEIFKYNENNKLSLSY